MTVPTLESVAKVFLVNEKNEMLILTIGEHMLQPSRSYEPDLPGGMVDLGESELLAARRELIEETGIVVDQSEFSLAYAKTEFYPGLNKSVSKLVYVVHLQNTPNVTLSWEHASFKWVPLSDVTHITLRPFFSEALKYCLTNSLL